MTDNLPGASPVDQLIGLHAPAMTIHQPRPYQAKAETDVYAASTQMRFLATVATRC